MKPYSNRNENKIDEVSEEVIREKSVNVEEESSQKDEFNNDQEYQSEKPLQKNP